MPKAATAVGTEQIKDLRERTGAGIMECKKALQEAGGQVEQAMKVLRAKGADVAKEKALRETRAGAVGSYIHGGKIGVLVEVNCETDFVARTDQFKVFVHEICLQVASMNPRYVSADDIPSSVSAKERKHHEEQVLLNQPYVKDSSKTIQDLLHEVVAGLKENLRIRRFVRFSLGEEASSASR